MHPVMVAGGSMWEMPVKRTHIRKYAFVLLVNLVILLVLLELVGVGVYYVTNGALYYTRTPHQPDALPEDLSEKPALPSPTALHPYLGFTRLPSVPISAFGERRLEGLLDGIETTPAWTALESNNHGFYSPHDYPYVKAHRNEYVIGVFGGSVAHWFALQGESQLREQLRQQPFFQDKEIVLLNFARGAYKQPQQLQALAFFSALGQDFDFVLNISGFNEIVLAYVNQQHGISASMPSSQIVLPILGLLGESDISREKLELLNTAVKSERALKRLERWESTNKSAGLHLFLSVFHAKAQQRHAETRQEVSDALRRSTDKTDLVHITERPSSYDPEKLPDDAWKVWLNASRVMQDICNAKAVPYLEVIQPNQYFSGKTFTPEEKAIAINQASLYKVPMELGGPLLDSHVRRMQDAGINVSSAVDIFDDVADPIYADSCCHYNQTGNEILADYIARSIFATVAP